MHVQGLGRGYGVVPPKTVPPKAVPPKAVPSKAVPLKAVQPKVIPPKAIPPKAFTPISVLNLKVLIPSQAQMLPPPRPPSSKDFKFSSRFSESTPNLTPCACRLQLPQNTRGSDGRRASQRIQDH